MDKQKPAAIDLKPVHGERTPRPVAVLATDPEGDIPQHRHRRGQLIHAIHGVMMVSTAQGSWVVPPGRGVWVPPRMSHEIRMAGEVRMRTVFVEPGARGGLPDTCRVIEVSELLRALILEGVALPLDYAAEGRSARIMELILDEIEAAPALALHVPMPRHTRLARHVRRWIADPSQPVSLEAWAQQLHMNPRTLARLFVRETGMNLGAWYRQARLLLSLARLTEGASILEVALAHGYESPSAFAAMFRRQLGVPPSQYIRSGARSEAA
ncbi:MAG: helix-turn-helix transcriptional regulator [Variovorax sp.]|nr:helix-turn-helix transcriptional regulator [Variovorax sp.]